MQTPILFIHGQTFDQYYWQAIRDLLAHPSAAIDLPSHGEADDLEPGDYAAFGRAVADAVQAAEEPKVALVGHSLGALAVVEGLIELSASNALDKVDRVLVIALVGEPTDEAAAAQTGFADLVAVHGLSDGLLGGVIASWLDAEWIAENDALKVVRDMQAHSTPARVEAVCRLLADRPTIVERIPSGLPPVTVVQLQRDQPTPPESAATVRDALGASTILDIDGPHLWPTQEPEAFAELIQDWIA